MKKSRVVLRKDEYLDGQIDWRINAAINARKVNWFKEGFIER
jgi:hypothetical protein